jgi:hypothetical protein
MDLDRTGSVCAVELCLRLKVRDLTEFAPLKISRI